jgi:hypothetical protein
MGQFGVSQKSRPAAPARSGVPCPIRREKVRITRRVSTADVPLLNDQDGREEGQTDEDALHIIALQLLGLEKRPDQGLEGGPGDGQGLPSDRLEAIHLTSDLSDCPLRLRAEHFFSR